MLALGVKYVAQRFTKLLDIEFFAAAVVFVNVVDILVAAAGEGNEDGA